MSHTSSHSTSCYGSHEAPQEYTVSAEEENTGNTNSRSNPWISAFALWNIRRYFRSIESTEPIPSMEVDVNLAGMTVVNSYHEDRNGSVEREHGAESAIYLTPSISAPSYIGSSWWSRNREELEVATNEVWDNLYKDILGLRRAQNIQIARMAEFVMISIYIGNMLKDLKQANKDLIEATQCEESVLVEGARQYLEWIQHELNTTFVTSVESSTPRKMQCEKDAVVQNVCSTRLHSSTVNEMAESMVERGLRNMIIDKQKGAMQDLTEAEELGLSFLTEAAQQYSEWIQNLLDTVFDTSNKVLFDEDAPTQNNVPTGTPSEAILRTAKSVYGSNERAKLYKYLKDAKEHLAWAIQDGDPWIVSFAKDLLGDVEKELRTMCRSYN